ncbi:cation:proton antiporter [Fodinisporobacter ferrooxydans]|uniref:Cation:proton antiporter n=1 Tax=Fodinisporobacter ferrooxydans TaxID=2901836 RepID=A0ABY4CME3_9BACL|nr:cation:proton antiporter [Alicyclobacillaceae bacterium MYW30-H2]
MHTQDSLVSLMIVVIIAFLIPIVLERLRWHFVPAVVLEIIAGILIGNSGIGWMQEDSWLHLLSTLGFMFLMFISGLEINFESFQSGKVSTDVRPGKLATITFLYVLLLSGVLGFFFQQFGFVKDGIFMGLMISTISLSIVVPTLKDKGITNTPYGQTVLLTAVISDFVTMILMSVYVAFHASNSAKPFLLLILFVVAFFFYRVVLHFKPERWIKKISKESVQLGTRGVFALILFFVVLSEKVGTESILGAFLAGVLISLMNPEKEFVDRLTSFGFGFLIPIFFFMVGAKLDLSGLIHDPKALMLVPLVLVSFFASKFFPTLLWRKWFPSRNALAAGLLLPSTLSLIIAGTTIAIELKIISVSVQAALILSGVISCLVSPILFQKMAFVQIPEARRHAFLIGANAITLSLARQLCQSGFGVDVYDTNPNEKKRSPGQENASQGFAIHSLPKITPDTLDNIAVEAKDSFIAFTGDESHNIQVANWAKRRGLETVICRLDNEQRLGELIEGIHVFSTFHSNRILLQALIENPTLVKFLEADHPVYEVKIMNERLHHKKIRDLPFVRDILVIRIFRGNEVIIPHGDTAIQYGDILLVSGDPVNVEMMRRECV